MKKLFANRQAVSVLWVTVSVFVLLVLSLQPIHVSLRHLIPESSLREQAIAALIGSIFGALIGSGATTMGILYTDRKKEVRMRDHQRMVEHYNSIVKLQRQTNIIRASMEDNASAIESIIEANKLGLPTFQRPIQIEYDEEPFEMLYDIKLINMLNDLYYIIRRMNLDTTNLNRSLDILADHLYSGKINNDQYKNEVLTFNDKIVSLRQHILFMLNHLVLDTIAYVRICADNDASQEMRDRQKKILDGRKLITDQEISKTRDIILEELHQSELQGEAEKAEQATYE